MASSLASPLLSAALFSRSFSFRHLSRNSAPASRSFRALSQSVRSSHQCTAFFKLGGQNAESAGIFASQGRDDYSADDVALYFDYSGMLAVEGTYAKMEALLNQGTHPTDILLLLAASEGDRRKIEELLRAGARCDVKDVDGRTALDRACDEEIREYIASGAMSGAAA